MKQLLLLLTLTCSYLFSPSLALAQYQLSGRVTNMESEDPIKGASVVLDGTRFGTTTDFEGRFAFENVDANNYTLLVSYLGFATHELDVRLTEDQDLAIGMVKMELLLDDVLISATRAKETSATTFTNVGQEELQSRNLGQDLPYLLEQTPSLVVTSDAGAGIGYSGLRIRGSDATRVNITINGIPLNDSESQGTFWVNLPDFASSIEDIQIQRGVGTSTNGAGAFGGSVNIKTTDMNDEAYGEIAGSVGSFNTLKSSVNFGTGLLRNSFTLDGRLSLIKSDGYVDRASSDLRSWFISGAWYGRKSILRANVFSGHEITYQSWNGVPVELLETDRTYNEYTYDNQVDDYQQDHYQLHFSHQFTDPLRLTAALHYTHGQGFYEQFKDGEDLADYGLNNDNVWQIGDGDTSLVTATDLIRRKWLDNDFYGFTYGLNYEKDRLDFTLGGGWNKYDGDHFGEVIWAGFMGDGALRDRYYDNTGVKTEGNIFLKADYGITDQLTLFGDLQTRMINYDITGVDEDQGPVDLSFDYTFFNPKVGLAYSLNPGQHVYASFSIANREPTRSNIVDNPVTPTSEQLQNLEVGFKQQGTRYHLNANYYLMNYKDQLVLTGNLNDVGNPIQQNVPKSFRTGIELAGGVRLFDQLSWTANATFSMNKIKEFSQTTSIFGNDWSYFGDTTLVYTDTDISFSPNFIAASTLSYEPLSGLEIALLSKYVGSQFLDNTSSEDRKLDAYFVNNLKLGYTLRTASIKEIEFTLLVNNLFNSLYSSNGYTYFIPFADSAENTPVNTNYNFHYPQAGINFLGGLRLKF